MKLKEIYEDVYTRLSGSEKLTALIGEGKIFDYLPNDEFPAPYIVIGDTNEVEGRIISDGERKVFIRLHIWSSYQGRSETVEIERALEDALMQNKNDYIFESFQVLRDERWCHGIVVFRTYIER